MFYLGKVFIFFVSKLPSLVCKIDSESNRSLSVKFCFWQKLVEKYITNKWWHSNMFRKIYQLGSFCRRNWDTTKLPYNFLNLVEFFSWIKNILKFISVRFRWEKRGILLTKTSPVKLKSDYMAFRNKQKVNIIKIMHPAKLLVLCTKDVKTWHILHQNYQHFSLDFLFSTKQIKNSNAFALFPLKTIQ